MDNKLRERLRQAKLTPRETLCLALSHYDGLPMRDIGKRLSVPLATVARAISTARQKLRAARLNLRVLTIEYGPMESLTYMPDIGPGDIKARW